MSLVLNQNITALGTGRSTSFAAAGGTSPYTYAVLPNGAGGTIDPAIGLYQAPLAVDSADPAKLFDTVQVVDALGAKASAQIFVGTALLLFCDIIQKEMGLENGRVYLWDQKIMQPTDSGLYVAVSVLRGKPFGNTTFLESNGLITQSLNMQATLEISAISRGPEARDRKEEILMALASIYSQQQQEANAFQVGKLPAANAFINLSGQDGAAIPYRFNISINVQYFVTKIKPVPYFDTFVAPQVTVNP